MFPSLQSLDIQVLVLTNYSMGWRCYSTRMRTLLEAGNMSEARLKAKNVTVRVFCQGCRLPDLGWGGFMSGSMGSLPTVKTLPKLGCTCEQDFGHMLVRMMRK